MPESAGRHVFPPSSGLREAVRRAQVERRRRLRVDRDRPAEGRAKCGPGAPAVGCPEDTVLPGGDVERSRSAGVDCEREQVVGRRLARRRPGRPSSRLRAHRRCPRHRRFRGWPGRPRSPRDSRRGSAPYATSLRRPRSSRSCCAPPFRFVQAPSTAANRICGFAGSIASASTESGDAGSVRHVLPPSFDLLTWHARHPQRHRSRCCRWDRLRARRRFLPRA